MKTIGGFADGAIIGSALLDKIEGNKGEKATSEAYNFVKTLVNVPHNQTGAG